MKGTNLGEFEELILLIVGVLYPDAYGLSIRSSVMEQSKRNVAIGAVHSALSRLEEKGFVDSSLSNATNERGGRRKKLFTITAAGRQADSSGPGRGRRPRRGNRLAPRRAPRRAPAPTCADAAAAATCRQGPVSVGD